MVVTVDLRPGVGLGPFTLGMPVCEALAFVEQHRQIYESVDIKYCEEDPLLLDLVLSFPLHGFYLRFEPRSQRLRLIEVFDITKLQMRYATSVIGGPNIPTTFVLIYALFGPTFPGTYDGSSGFYSLFYPGLSFRFPIPPQYTERCLQREAELPLEFPDGTTPVTSRLCIYTGTGGSGAPEGKCVPPQLPVGSLYMEEVRVKLAESLFFTGGGQEIAFGASPQDVWSDLGRPDGIYPKQVDTMLIHVTSDPRPRTALCGDYFFNYFTRGVDILFDGRTHRIKKFVLHSNYPGHPDFNMYIKCNFSIDCPAGMAVRRNDHRLTEATRSSADGSRRITVDTKWEEIQSILGDGGRAAIQTRGSIDNPFGPTRVYGYRNVVFEVMKNGHIATVTLFQATPT